MKLEVRFRRTSQPSEGTTYLFRAHGVLFELGSGPEDAPFVWVSAYEPETPRSLRIDPRYTRADPQRTEEEVLTP